MIPVEVMDGLKVRFPTRSDDFRAGLEIGLLLADIASEPIEFSRTISAANLEQAQVVLQGFNYRIVARRFQAGLVEIDCAGPRARPRLRIVRSQGASGGT